MKIIIGFVLCFTFISCKSQLRTIDKSFSFSNETIQPNEFFEYGNGWYKVSGNVRIDTLTLYGEETSLLLMPQFEDSLKLIEVFCYIDLRDINGDSITISGNFKIGNERDYKAMFNTSLISLEEQITDTININFSGEKQTWNDFTSTMPLKDNIIAAKLNFRSKGDIKIWLSSFKVEVDKHSYKDLVNKKYDLEKDTVFDNGSNIQLEKLTPQMTENLEVLGKVWGFLKYYHPEVTQGKFNWDYELFRILPAIANAKNKNERSKLLYKWINKYEYTKKTTNYTIADSTQYSRIINLDWIEDKSLFDDRLIDQLTGIRNAERSNRFNYYVLPNRITLNDKVFAREKAYKKIKWNDQGFRLLTLFRMWNVVEYCFPYRDYTNTSWDKLLKMFIPVFFSPSNKADYELSILKLGAHINDSHGIINIPDDSLGETVLAPIYKHRSKVPVELIRTKDGCITIKSTQTVSLERGDVILSIDNRDIKDIIEEIHPYILASTENGIIKNILSHLLSTDSSELVTTILRNGQKKEVVIKDFRYTRDKQSIKTWENYDLSSKNIIHVDNIKSAEVNKETVKNQMDSKGLIIDMRVYPAENNLVYMYELLLPSISFPLWMSSNQLNHPGNYHLWRYNIEENKNDNYYKGKVAILVDENTISGGETVSMWLSAAPLSVVIGSQTAGANGNISFECPLPHNIMITYSGLGAYYLNGDIIQRKGINIDIPVSPSVRDIREGRDVWIEKAIEYILK